jgi:hypothetical protein
MYRQHFHIGDRVHTIHGLTGIPLGTCGTVVNVFISADVCDIRFDGYGVARIVHPNNLEREPIAKQVNGASGENGTGARH